MCPHHRIPPAFHLFPLSQLAPDHSKFLRRLLIERATAVLDERRAEYVAKRDAAAMPTTKALYQAFIDAIDRIKEKMDGK